MINRAIFLRRAASASVKNVVSFRYLQVGERKVRVARDGLVEQRDTLLGVGSLLGCVSDQSIDRNSPKVES